MAVFDTGGGSSQFTFGHGLHVDEHFSVNVGAVRYTERFGLADAVAPEVLRDALAAISADLSRIDGRPPPDALVGMGGALTNLTAVKLGWPATTRRRPGRGPGPGRDRPPDRALPSRDMDAR